MALNSDQIAQDMGAEIVGEVPETGGGAFGAARILKVIGELNMNAKPAYTCLDCGMAVWDKITKSCGSIAEIGTGYNSIVQIKLENRVVVSISKEAFDQRFIVV